MTALIPSLPPEIYSTLSEVARFYDQRKVGTSGGLGFRRSSDLTRLASCLPALMESDLLILGQSRFLDLGCADGRVNVLFSYLVRLSVGVELDEWTLEEYDPLKTKVTGLLESQGLSPPPSNVFLFQGDSTDEVLHKTIQETTGTSFEDFDLFYTYLTMQEEFADLIARKARSGAVFMVYGLESILPRLTGFQLLTPVRPLEGILALYRKE